MAPKWWALSAVACGTFMATLDSSVVNVALPTLTKDLLTEISLSKWVVVVYLFVISCLLLPFGKLSDNYGRRKIFTIGLLVFTVGSALCGFSKSLGWLIVARIIQGIGASMLMANGPAILTSSFPQVELGKALGTMAMVVSLGLVSGPSIGGYLIAHAGWQSIFLVNIPFGILGILLAVNFIAEDRPRTQAKLKPFDWAGAFLQIVLIVMLTVLFDPPNVSVSGTNPLAFSRILAAILFLIFAAVFVRIEASVEDPLLDLSLLKNRDFWAGNVAGLFNFIAYSTVAVLMPFFLEEVKGYTTNKTGLFMTAIPLTIFVVAPISGRLSDHLGTRGLSVAGAAVSATTLFIMSGVVGSGLHRTMSEVYLVCLLSMVGVAMGLFQSPNNNAIMSSVPMNKLGIASAMLATVRNIGMVTGTGLSTSMFSLRLETTQNFVSSMHWSCFLGGIMSCGAVIASFVRHRRPVKR